MNMEIILEPRAASLIQSMRDLGYSLESAVADLIDNSISAKASNVRLFLLEVDDPERAHLAIVDDGKGMDETELREAMRPGSRDPRESRAKDDLGRFGLGLKTASFSQCRSLTVVSRTKSGIVGALWDLDLVAKRNQWIMTILSEDAISELPCVDQLPVRGTLVLWRKLDRLLENLSADRRRRSADDKLETLERHLSLVFHRYIAGEYRKSKLNISVNGHEIDPFDPFCTENKATQRLHEETIRIHGSEIRITPYILPHRSKMSKREQEFYTSRSELVTNQGAYVYRNGRLMAWGDWFRIIPKSEATKLARVRIDFPNRLDSEWTVDIKKSRAHPPFQVKATLAQIIPRITEQSRRIYKGRGDKLFENREYPYWLRTPIRGDGIRYEINREHPLIKGLSARMDSETWKALEGLLKVTEHSIPVDAIYADFSATPQAFDDKPEVSEEELQNMVVSLYRISPHHLSHDKDGFLDMIEGLPPFNTSWQMTRKIIEDIN